MKVALYILLLLSVFTLSGCKGKEDKQLEKNLATYTLNQFKLEGYLGEWEEVFRTDNKFERGLSNVTASYYREEGKLRVRNQGWDEKNKKWKKVEGYIKTTDKEWRLKVSFFRPFYGGYNVLSINKEKNLVAVGGGSKTYFWVLKRKGTIVENEREEIRKLIELGKKFGYEIDTESK